MGLGIATPSSLLEARAASQQEYVKPLWDSSKLMDKSQYPHADAEDMAAFDKKCAALDLWILKHFVPLQM